MYISGTRAMSKRMMLASPVCAVDTMQQPDLGCTAMGCTHGNYVSLGALSDYNANVGGISVNIPLVLGGIALLGVAFSLLSRSRNKKSKGKGLKGKGLVRRTTTTFVPA